MAMTRQELREEVLFNLGNHSDDDRLASRVNTWLNWTLEDLAKIRNWNELVRWDKQTLRTRVDGLEYALPSNLRELIKLNYQDDSSSVELAFKDERVFDALWPCPTADGSSTPLCYTIRGPQIELYPIPSEGNKALHLYGSWWPTLLAGDTDVPDLTRMDDVITAGATLTAYNALNDDTQEGKWRGIFIKRLRRRANADGEPQRWTPIWGSVPITRPWRRAGLFYVGAIGAGNVLAGAIDVR